MPCGLLHWCTVGAVLDLLPLFWCGVEASTRPERTGLQNGAASGLAPCAVLVVV
ncbi:hypothetical protein DWUX_2039 [Desulfovibrio diazotrophicus]|nr:hypothetical protein DWUX_2039 [Desulfovibrio diazotrophicus]